MAEMTETNQREIITWSKYATTLAGATRKALLFDRPWQQPMAIAPESCPFEPERDDAEKTMWNYKDPEGWEWRARLNDATPFDYHRLIIPPRCMSVEKLWTLGGKEKIAAALATAACGAQTEDVPLFFYVHVGYTAGQRFGHLHWHLNSPELPQGEIEMMYRPIRARGSKLTLWEDDLLFVSAGGVRAGMCLVVPKHRPLNIGASFDRDHLAQTLDRLITLCNEKFRSTQGFPPDYEVCLVLKNGLCEWACYIPILNFMGGSEHLAMMTGSDYVIPWPHKVTAAYLRGESA